MIRLCKIISVILLFSLSVLCAGGVSNDAAVEQDEPGFWGSIWEGFVDFFVPHVEKRKFLLRKQTQYFLVTVEVDHNGWRHLVFNPRKGSQGIWNPEKPDDIISNYCKHTTLYLTMVKQPPQRVLFIGMGAGILPRFFAKHYPETVIDIVEIDKEIPEIAEKYFGYTKSPNTNIIIQDGRDFINRTKHKYDLVVIDAYNSSCIPFHLTTQEFYKKIRQALNPDGIVTANVANVGKPEFVGSELKTINSVFPELEVYVCPNGSDYIPFAALKREFNDQSLSKNAEKIDSEKILNYKLTEVLDTRMKDQELKEMMEDKKVLTDDFAPVETMK